MVKLTHHLHPKNVPANRKEGVDGAGGQSSILAGAACATAWPPLCMASMAVHSHGKHDLSRAWPLVSMASLCIASTTVREPGRP
eukprot:102930-Chlamydomonas_euryale.AAC.8